MEERWTVGKILKWTEEFFAGKGIESARLDAEVLLAHVMKCERIFLYVHFDEPMVAAELAEFRALVKKRAERYSVAHIFGEREFMGMMFKVSEDCLIPRPDTEILVEAAMERLRTRAEKDGAEEIRFADIGTGSGAICLSILHMEQAWQAVTVDLSAAARSIAEENARLLGVAERVRFLTGDLLAPLAGEKFHAILSNPPYIPAADYETLEPEVRLHDPKIALVGGADGLDFYRKIFAEAKEHLLPKGFLAVEVGAGQAKPVAALAQENGWGTTEIIEDYAGIERVVLLPTD